MQVEPRWRTGIGMILIVLLICVWTVLAVSAAPLVANAPMSVQFLYYAVAGLAWLLPLKPLIRWMHTGRWRG